MNDASFSYDVHFAQQGKKLTATRGIAAFEHTRILSGCPLKSILLIVRHYIYQNVKRAFRVCGGGYGGV